MTVAIPGMCHMHAFTDVSGDLHRRGLMCLVLNKPNLTAGAGACSVAVR